ncbi:hypothetical protein H6P81_015610 [Aristolochia fimbriata]|uniref:FAD-binding domain-containing protein n=1 Tax=Aristolochia fimbriata TaxID=158543 RepID=A0AAV7E615_ARIFI|nr:hypothetical protein H6P81_015610 [Aristolochia fimbriata]
MDVATEEVVIVGGGIAGLATAVALHRVGVRCLVLEKAQELRATGGGIILFRNAWRALEALGVAHSLSSLCTPSFSRGRITHVVGGVTRSTHAHSYGSGAEIRVVHRKTLLMVLAKELPQGTIRFSSHLTSMETKTVSKTRIVLLHLQDGSVIHAKAVIGCDGIHSVVAQWLGLSSPIYDGRRAIRGLASSPQFHDLNMEGHQIVGEGVRAGVAPISESQVHWFIVHKASARADHSEDPKQVQQDIMENLAKGFPSLFLDIVQNTDLTTVTCSALSFRAPWNLIFGPSCKGNVTVAGDALHPMTSDLGQGGCVALEDAVVLAQKIAALTRRQGEEDAILMMDHSVGEAFQRYVKERKWRLAWVITGSFLTGWIQTSGTGWFVRLVREKIFLKFLYPRILKVSYYDCGKLN